MRTWIRTCSERRPLLSAMMERWAATGLPLAKVLVDVSDDPPSPWRNRRAFESAMADALSAGDELCLFVEDDIGFNDHFRENLLTWPPVADRDLCPLLFASLYRPRGASDDPRQFWCMQALLVSRAFLQIAAAWWNEPRYDPTCISAGRRLGSIAADAGVPLRYHVPSLVEHLGEDSLVMMVAHQAIDFDPSWRRAHFGGKP